MSSSKGSTSEKSGVRPFGFSGKRCGAKGNWSPLNTAAMVFGFIFFWPVGLVILYWNISGRDVRDLPAAAKEKWEMFRGKQRKQQSSDSDNSLFNEFQQTQYDRIREIKEEIVDRSNRFQEYRSDAKRRADEEEFNSFMSSSPERSGN
jgi:hypothetical protein